MKRLDVNKAHDHDDISFVCRNCSSAVLIPLGIIHLVSLNLPKNKHFLPPDTKICLTGGKKCWLLEYFP